MSNKQFFWQGIKATAGNKVGAGNKTLQGEIDASSKLQARLVLRQQGITALQIKKQRKNQFSFEKNIKTKQASFIFRQLAVMLSAGLSITQALRSIAETTNNSQLFNSLAEQIETGSSLHQALCQHAQQFDPLTINLIKIAERSGTLDTILTRIADYQEQKHYLNSKIKTSMAYPCCVICVAIVVSLLLLTFVIPQFETLFQSTGGELPGLTKAMIALSQFTQNNLLAIIISSTALIAGTLVGYRRFTALRYTVDRVSLTIPVFNRLIKNAIYARFNRTLAILFAAGINIVDACQETADCISNRYYQQAIFNLANDLKSGLKLSQSMANSQVFESTLIQMIACGEQSGQLEIVLNKLADYYENEVAQMVDSLSSLIEPMMIIVLGVIIAIMIISMYLPIFAMASVF